MLDRYFEDEKHNLKSKNITKLPKLDNLIEIHIPQFIRCYSPKNVDDWWGGKEYELFSRYKDAYYIDNEGFVSIYEHIRGNRTCFHTLNIGNGLFTGIRCSSGSGKDSGNLTFTYCYRLDDDNSLYKGEYTIIEDECIQYIFIFNDTIYVLGGDADMGVNYGFLYRLKYVSHTWEVDEKIDLNECPMFYQINNNEIIILTRGGIVFCKDNKITKQFKDQKWVDLFYENANTLNYANSLYLSNNKMFIGARGCLLVFDLDNCETKAYKQNIVA